MPLSKSYAIIDSYRNKLYKVSQIGHNLLCYIL